MRAQEEGRFRGALERYAEVRKVIVSPQLLFNIGTCRERLDELLEARETFEAALSLAQEKGESAVIEAATARVAALDKEIPRLVVRLAPGTEGAVATFDEVNIAIEALENIRANPGIHRLVIRSDLHTDAVAHAIRLNRQEVRELDVSLGERRARDEAPPVVSEREPRSPLPPPPQQRKTYLPAIVASGVTLALGSAVLVTGIVGESKRSRFDELNGAPTAANRAEREALRDDGTALYTAKAILFVGTILAAGVTTYLFLRPPRTTTGATSNWLTTAGVRF